VSGAVETNAAVADFANWLDTYFSNSTLISETKIPYLCTVNTSGGKYLFLTPQHAEQLYSYSRYLTLDGSFYDKVYSALLQVPFGKTVSYKQLAAMGGSPSEF
jgi:hypothetical protein